MTPGGGWPVSSIFPRSICKPLVLGFAILCAVGSVSAQLSQNSGINPYDTYAIFDITVSGRAITALSQPLYDPVTQTMRSTMDMTLTARRYHVEVGYDSNDQLVMNIFPLDPVGDPMQYPFEDISRVELRNGKLVIFGAAGTAMPLTLPHNAPLPEPLALLGAIPASSVLSQLVISDASTKATALNGTLSESYETTTSSSPDFSRRLR